MRHRDPRACHPRTFASLIVVGTLALAGCSSDDDDDTYPMTREELVEFGVVTE